MLASKGYNVYLLDLDFYAPSLYSYFNVEPKFWINDYLRSKASLDDIMVDSATILDHKLDGTLMLGFSRGGKEDIYQLEGSLLNDREQQVKQFRNFIAMREELLVSNDADYIIMDTSPGIRYWSINSIVISDMILLTLKMGDLDLQGTIKMIKEIYGSLVEHGTICKLLLNRVSGYCVPTNNIEFGSDSVTDDDSFFRKKIDKEIAKLFKKTIDIDTLLEIPCYCDIQFKEKEFLTSREFPTHPFTKKIKNLVEEFDIIN